MTNDPFVGFPEETLGFLAALSEHNDRDWYRAHKKDYDSYVKEPARAFIVAVGERLPTLDPEVTADPRTYGSLFRQARDIRFSKDKRPYKEHVDLWFWHGEDKRGVPGFFVRIRAEELTVGCGMHVFSKEQLQAYRLAAADDTLGPMLVQAANEVESGSPYEVGGEALKRIPSGYGQDHPREKWLRHKGLHVSWTGPVPPELHTEEFVGWCMQHWRAGMPVYRWLLRILNP